MNNSLSYDINFIDVLSALAPINEQVLVNKSDNKLFVTSNTRDTKVYYTVSADADKFNFTGSKFAIRSYPKFKQFFTSCQVSDKSKQPILETVNDEAGEPLTVVIKQPVINAELKHPLAFVDAIIKPALYNAEDDSYFEIAVTEESAKFELTNEQLRYIQSMVSTVGATNIKFSVNNGICTITLFNPKTSDVFSQSYAVTTLPNSTAFDITISATSLSLLPNSKYALTIDKEGLIHFAQERTDGIDVNLYLVAEA